MLCHCPFKSQGEGGEWEGTRCEKYECIESAFAKLKLFSVESSNGNECVFLLYVYKIFYACQSDGILVAGVIYLYSSNRSVHVFEEIFALHQVFWKML